LTRYAEAIAGADRIITDRVALARFFGVDQPWGARAHGSDRAVHGKRLSTVLTHWQICHLAEASTMPWRDQQPGIPYLDGLVGLPGLDRWESPRAARRRAAERERRIREQAAREFCRTCEVREGPCRTKTGRLAEMFHKPRLAAAVKQVDAHGAEEETR
jgi:hypothetical protein